MPQFVEGSIVGGFASRRAHLVRDIGRGSKIGRGLPRGAVERLKGGGGGSMTVGQTDVATDCICVNSMSFNDLSNKDCQQTEIKDTRVGISGQVGGQPAAATLPV